MWPVLVPVVGRTDRSRRDSRATSLSIRLQARSAAHRCYRAYPSVPMPSPANAGNPTEPGSCRKVSDRHHDQPQGGGAGPVTRMPVPKRHRRIPMHNKYPLSTGTEAIRLNLPNAFPSWFLLVIPIAVADPRYHRPASATTIRRERQGGAAGSRESFTLAATRPVNDQAHIAAGNPGCAVPTETRLHHRGLLFDENARTGEVRTVAGDHRRTDAGGSRTLADLLLRHVGSAPSMKRNTHGRRPEKPRSTGSRPREC